MKKLLGMGKKLFIAVLFMGALYNIAIAGEKRPRVKKSFNEGWMFKFAEEADSAFRRVDVPHSWNATDPFDEIHGYRRTVAVYQKRIDLSPEAGRIYKLQFEAVNQIAEVFVNGQKAGRHLGGYTGFVVDITSYLQEGENTISVRVDNRHNTAIAPLKGDFNFYGGIYRDVWLLELSRVRFGFDTFGASQLYINYPHVSSSSATIEVSAAVIDERVKGASYQVVHRLIDRRGTVVAEQKSEVKGRARKESIAAALHVENPMLWHPKHPYLYTLVSEIREGSKILDRLTNPVGLRWFRFDADNGFFLNGKPLKLMGVNRHQDYPGLGSALRNARHVADVKLVKATGANFLRTAHYPQDPAVLEACNRLGLLVSMEIPLDHEITDSEAFYKNTIRMQREMIRQNYNHPSIIIWAYMNEMLLGRSWEEDQAAIAKITRFAKKLESVTRQEDPARYTMIPNHGQFELYHKAGLTGIPMIVGWNLYFGWYEKQLNGLGAFMDHFHKMLPDKPAIITEFGAGSDPRIRSLQPTRFDFSVEWQNIFLRENLNQIIQRPYIAGAAVWNVFDFGSEKRRDAVPRINSKGLMTFNRVPKDSYYILQSWLKDKPFVAIGSAGWKRRAGRTASRRHETVVQQVDVYGNTGQAELFANGRTLGKKKLKKHQASWKVPFRNGLNKLKAVAHNAEGTIEDRTTIDFALYKPLGAHRGEPFKDIYINTGADFFFLDKTDGVIWQPDYIYQEGFWGYTGGHKYKAGDRGIGTSADIKGTELDPLFQTQRINPESYRFDVPPGTYEILLLLSVLKDETNFGVRVNGIPVLESIDLNESHRAIRKKVQVYTRQPRLILRFVAGEKPAVINGIGIRKIN